MHADTCVLVCRCSSCRSQWTRIKMRRRLSYRVLSWRTRTRAPSARESRTVLRHTPPSPIHAQCFTLAGGSHRRVDSLALLPPAHACSSRHLIVSVAASSQPPTMADVTPSAPPATAPVAPTPAVAPVDGGVTVAAAPPPPAVPTPDPAPAVVAAPVTAPTGVTADNDSSSSEAPSEPSKKRTSVWSRFTTGSVYAAEVSRRRTEAAGLLALWSAAVTVEGLVRFVTADATQDLLPDSRPSTVVPPLLPFLGALFEVAFGVMGLMVAIVELAFASGGVVPTLAFLAAQVPLSWFTYVVWVFLLPAYQWRLNNTTPLGGPEDVLSVANTHGLIATGVITSVAFCAALQGGQFVFGLRLLAFQAQQAVEAPPALLTVGLGYNRLRAMFWSALMVVGGGGTLAAGIILTIAIGGGRVSAPNFFSFPPHVGVFPIQSIVTGGVMIAHGLVGLVAAAVAGRGALGRTTVTWHVHTTPLVWVVLLLNFCLVQVAAIGPSGAAGGPGRASFAAAVHAGLTLVSTFIGPYFVVAASRDADEDGLEGGGAPA